MKKQLLAARVVVALVLVMPCTWAAAGFPGTDVFLPSVGRAAGAAGSEWYTTVWVHNPGSQAANVQVLFLLRDQANPSPASFSGSFAPGETIRFADAITDMFHTTGLGALRFVSDQRLLVVSRIYSQPAGGGEADSVGQFFAGVPAELAVGQGRPAAMLGVYQTQPAVDSQFRYNFGFVETTGASATVRVRALETDGSEVASHDYSIGAFEARQYSIDYLVPGIDSINLRLEVEVIAGSGRVVAYGSGLANLSNDPSTFEMSFPPELLESTAGEVSHDSTLSGNGTPSAPLGVADGGVSQVKLAVSGTATSGSVLGTDGTELTWQSGGGLTLPYSASANTSAPTPLISVENSGNGYGLFAATGIFEGWVGFSDGAVVGHETVNRNSGYLGRADCGVYGHAYSGRGVYGESSSAAGVYGVSTVADGVVGSSSAATKSGVYGATSAGDGYGVFGRNDNSGRYGYLGGPYGVYGTGGSARGVMGESSSAAGVYGKSTSGSGVIGESSSWTGVAGSSQASNGVTGITAAAGKSGVWGDSTAGVGVTGSSAGDVGVSGVTTSNNAETAAVSARNDGAGIGLYAAAGSSELAAVLRGNVHVLSHSSGAIVLELGEGLDYAEGFDLSTKAGAEPGSVLVIDLLEPGKLTLSTAAYDRRVAGVVAGAGDLGSGVRLGGDRFDEHVALAGRVYCNVDATEAGVEPGDLLTTSATPGYAMKAGDVTRAQGAVLGKAMERLELGQRGRILVLVTLQ